MGRIRVTQIRSTIKRPKTQIDTIQSLGLGKIGRVKEHEATPQILGMVRKVNHLIAVEEV